jgi:putative inorganic carbon (hco3(-)) transporter
MEISEKNKARNPVYLYALFVFSAVFLYSLIFGYSGQNPKLVFGAIVFLVTLLYSYYSVPSVFLAFLFFIPFLIGADVYQINIGSFIQNFVSVGDIYINPFSLVCLLLVFFAVVEFLKRGLAMARTPLFFVLSVSIALSLATLLFSKYKMTGLVFELYLMAGFMSYFLGYLFLGTKAEYVKTLFVAILSSIMPAMYAFIQIASGDYFYEADSALGRINATFPHSNTFGSYLFVVLTVMLISAFAIRLKNKNKKNNLTLFLPFVVLLPLLVLTYSRTAWIGFAISIIAIATLRPFLRLPTAYSGALTASLLLLYGKTRERILGIFESHMFDSMYGRRETWDMALFAAQKKPWIGYGMGSFETIIKNVQGKETGNVYPHNDAIRFFLEGGIIGLASYLLYMIGAIYYSLKSFLRFPSGEETVSLWGRDFVVDFRLLGIIPFLLFSIMIVISMVEAPSMDFVYQIFAWTMLGSWLGMSREYYKK